MTPTQIEQARKMYDETDPETGELKYTVAQIAETFGVGRATIYRHLDKANQAREDGPAAKEGQAS